MTEPPLSALRRRAVRYHARSTREWANAGGASEDDDAYADAAPVAFVSPRSSATAATGHPGGGAISAIGSAIPSAHPLQSGDEPAGEPVRRRTLLERSAVLVLLSGPASSAAAQKQTASLRRTFFALAALELVVVAVSTADALQRARGERGLFNFPTLAAAATGDSWQGRGGVVHDVAMGGVATMRDVTAGLFMPEYSVAGAVSTSATRDSAAGASERRWLARPPLSPAATDVSRTGLALQVCVTLTLLAAGCVAAFRASTPLLTAYCAASIAWVLLRLVGAGPVLGVGLPGARAGAVLPAVDPGGAATLAFAMAAVFNVLPVLCAYRLRELLAPAWFASARGRLAIT
jgi:hypothetical protein